MTFSSKLFLNYIFIFIAFTIVSVLATWYPIEVSTLTNIIFPILAMSIFGMLTRFGYIKLTTLIIGRGLFILAAFSWGEQHIHTVCLVLLQLNILEATIFDFSKKNYFNAVNGLLLLGSSFYLMLSWTGNYITIDNENYLLWIIAYTLWNANFVTLQLSNAYYLHHFLLLLSPIVACLVLLDFSYWLMFRETSLLLGIATLTCFKPHLFKMEQQPFFMNIFEKIQLFIQSQKTQLGLLLVMSTCIFLQMILF